jgi:hypothetical protein
MQNKPNFRDAQMNVTYFLTKNYEQLTMNNEPTKQTQSKPIFVPLVLFIAYNRRQVPPIS